MIELPVEYPNYCYHATVTRIVDGDTIWATVDLGFDVLHRLKLRLEDINTQETRGKEREEGLKDKAYVESILSVGDAMVIKSYKKGGFDRYAARIWCQLFDGSDLIDLNFHLVDQGIADYSPWR